MKQVLRLTESDLHNIVRDSVYHILENKQNLDEGWKNWAMAGALGAASMFGNPQTANAQNYTPSQTVQQSKYSPNDVRDINMQIIQLKAEAKVSNNERIEELEKQRDYMVSTFSRRDKTIMFGEDKNSVTTKLSIGGWWSKRGTSFSEEGRIEKIYFEAFSTMYVGEDELEEGQDYEFTFFNGKLKNIDTAKNHGEKWEQEIDYLRNQFNNINRGIGLQTSPKKEKKKLNRSYDDDIYFK